MKLSALVKEGAEASPRERRWFKAAPVARRDVQCNAERPSAPARDCESAMTCGRGPDQKWCGCPRNRRGLHTYLQLGELVPAERRRVLKGLLLRSEWVLSLSLKSASSRWSSSTFLRACYGRWWMSSGASAFLDFDDLPVHRCEWEGRLAPGVAARRKSLSGPVEGPQRQLVSGPLLAARRRTGHTSPCFSQPAQRGSLPGGQ